MVSPFTIATRMKAREYIVDMPITDHCTVLRFGFWILDSRLFLPLILGGRQEREGRGGEGREKRGKKGEMERIRIFDDDAHSYAHSLLYSQ
jgi:hypothetical protein